MRIWDIHPKHLCRQHLLGEHRELHGLYNILTQGKKGYSNHPETKRWVGYLGALWCRHLDLVDEMDRRGYNHKSPLTYVGTVYLGYPKLIDSIERQIEILKSKNCDCFKEE